jgi:hypothetical protein
MKKYLFFSLLVLVALMIASCGPKEVPASLCGNRVCDADKGETAQACAADCKQAVAEPQQEPVKEGDVKLYLQPSSSSAAVGETVTLSVMVSGVNDLYGFQFDINYNPDVVEVKEVKEETFLNNNGKGRSFCVSSDMSTAGSVKHVVCTRLGEGSVNGSGVLETLTFKTIEAGTSEINLSRVKLADSRANDIEFTSTNGNIEVK